MNHLRSDAGGVGCAGGDRRIRKNAPSNMAFHAREGGVFETDPACIDDILSPPTAHPTPCAKCKSFITFRLVSFGRIWYK